MWANGTKARRINQNNAARMSRASRAVLEVIESRLLMSTTLAAWAFDTLPASTSTSAVQTSPAPTSGSGTAYTVGMQSGTANGYLYPAAGANAIADASTFLAATGTADSGGNGGSEGGTNGFVWRVQSGQDNAAPIASQGVQFNVPTSGQSGISLQFDMNPSSGKAEAQFVVEYTTDVQHGANAVWTDVTQDLTFGPANVADPNNANHIATIGTSSSDDIQIQANTSNDPNMIPTGVSGNLNGNGGYYATIKGPLVGGSNTGWLNDLTLDLSGIAAVNNAPNFAFRVVNAATGSSETSVVAGAVTNGQFKNWRFNDIAVIANGSSAAAPVVTTNPTDQTVAAGQPVTFTAAASGALAPTVQWYSGAVGSGTLIVGATSPSYTFTPTAGQSGTTYYAVFTNASGSTPTSAATLTVTTSPTITRQPASQTVSAGSTNVTFTAGATGAPTPTVQWEVEAPGASSFTPVSGPDYTEADSTTLTILTANESLSGNTYKAVFTNPSGSTSTSAADLTVTGTPIAQWEFTSGLGAPGGTAVVQGTGNAPNPTFGLAGSLNSGTPDTAQTIGLNNDYTGVEAFPESDVIPLRSTVNSGFVEYIWRLRSGNGSGPTGSPGTPEGWSQNAPQYSQGVQFDVDTTGYSNITLHFDWNQGGISDMQPLYSTDGGQTWTLLPNGLIAQAAPAGDYYGITPHAPPTGVTVNLQGIAGVNDNPHFELRLAAAYNSTLPLIIDGNLILNGGNTATPHGQYATGVAGSVNAQQVVQFGNDENSTNDVTGGTFTLTFGGATTGPIAFSSNDTTLAANISAALNALTVNGVANYLQGNFAVSATNFSGGTELNPVRDALGVVPNTMTVTFKGALAATPVSTMSADGTGLTGTNPSVVVQDYVNGSANGFLPYVDGGGAWEIGNISFNGFSTNASGLGITAQPASTQVAGGGVATFTATAYSEATPAIVWQVSTDNGATWATATGTTSPLTFTNAANNSYASTFSYTSHTNLADNGYEFRAVFSVAASSVTSNAAILTVVTPSAPVVTLQPTAVSVLVGDVATDTAAATGAPTPTVQWQISSDGGSTWANIADATSSNLSFTPTAGENGDLIRAVFFNAVATGGVNSNAVVLSVLSPQTIITDWDFNNSQYASTAAYNNSPAPSGGVIGVGTAEQVGMDLPYNFNDSASGTDGNGAVTDGDITNSASSLNPNFNENTWRIRGGVPAADGGVPTGGTPANGWSNLVPQYTQGLQITVPTTGYQGIYVTLDWFSTHSAELDAQEQYTIGGTTVAVTAASSANNANIQTGAPGIDNIATLSAPNSFQFGDEVTVTGLPAPYDGTFQIVSATATTFSYYTPTLGASWSGTGSAYVPTWVNLGNPIQNNTTPSGNDDFYGITADAPPVPVIFNLTGIAGAANNPNFGIRLVNAYDPYLSNTQTLTLGDTGSFSLSFNGQATASIPYSANTGTETAAIESALGALPNVGASNVTVTYNTTTSDYSITFGNALGLAAQPPITVVNDANDAVTTHYQYANATEVGSPVEPVPYNGSKGNWRFDNIEVHGIAPAGAVAGSVFNDTNDNGVRDSGEPGLAGVTVYLDANNNGVLDSGEISVTTAADGSYLFADVSAGDVTVREMLPTGWARTAPLTAGLTVSVGSTLTAVGPTFGDVQISTVPMDFNYLLILAQHYGQQGTFADGDLNADGTVNFADLLVLAQNYGHPLPAAAAAPAAASGDWLLADTQSRRRRLQA